MAEEIMFEHFVRKLLTALERYAIGYLVVGGVAAVYYGRPRTTSDCDVILSLSEEQLDGFVACLRKEGFRIREYDVREALREKSHFNAYLGTAPFRVDFSWRTGSLAEHGFDRARRVSLLGIRVHMESPEDVIIAKLVYGSPQDLEDAKAILAMQKKLDGKYLARRAAEEGVKSKLGQLYKSIL
jgi:hypothetical protein